jgi:hypothetical protein
LQTSDRAQFKESRISSYTKSRRSMGPRQFPRKSVQIFKIRPAGAPSISQLEGHGARGSARRLEIPLLFCHISHIPSSGHRYTCKLAPPLTWRVIAFG